MSEFSDNLPHGVRYNKPFYFIDTESGLSAIFTLNEIPSGHK